MSSLDCMFVRSHRSTFKKCSQLYYLDARRCRTSHGSGRFCCIFFFQVSFAIGADAPSGLDNLSTTGTILLQAIAALGATQIAWFNSRLTIRALRQRRLRHALVLCDGAIPADRPVEKVASADDKHKPKELVAQPRPGPCTHAGTPKARVTPQGIHRSIPIQFIGAGLALRPRIALSL